MVRHLKNKCYADIVKMYCLYINWLCFAILVNYFNIFGQINYLNIWICEILILYIIYSLFCKNPIMFIVLKQNVSVVTI